MIKTFDADINHPWAKRWRIPRVTNPYQHDLWPLFNMPDKQAQFPPTAAGLVALLDHICWDKSWPEWMASHPRIEQLVQLEATEEATS